MLLIVYVIAWVGVKFGVSVVVRMVKLHED